MKKKQEIPGGLTPREAAEKMNAAIRSGKLVIPFEIPRWGAADRPPDRPEGWHREREKGE